MPSKRVSLKGKGADLFFGDYSPGQAEPAHLDAGNPGPPLISNPADGDEPRAVSPTCRTRKSASVAFVPIISANNDASSLASTTACSPDGVDASEPTAHSASDHAIKLASLIAETIESVPRSPQQSDMHDDSHADSSPASKLASRNSIDAILSAETKAEAIRKVVKVPGREVSFVRLTPEEKAQVSDIVYAYKRRGQRTSENEIHRIALSHLLDDYHEHGPDSMLARVLAALQA